MSEFTNVPIQFEEIPTADDIIYNPIERKVLYVQAANVLISTMIFLGILYFIKLNPPKKTSFFNDYFNLIAGIILTIAALRLLMNYLGFKWKGFIVREKDVIYRTGLIFRKTVHVPFNRVQHCEVNQGVIDRMLDLAKLKIFTAGGSKSDLTIPGLKNQTALDLKSFILKKTSENE